MESYQMRLTNLRARRKFIRWFSNRLIPQDVRELLQTIEQAGGQAYIVGGCVRDLLMKRAPGDWDVATSLPPDVIQALFPKTVPTGLSHGTVSVVTFERQVEVTTFRSEGRYSDHRHPDWVRFSEELSEDLKRRDFTINALALDARGRLHDPIGGLEDLARRRVITVGVADERFAEDALRMVRAVRFATELGFDIDDDVLTAIQRHSRLLREVSAERIRQEVHRILMSDEPARGFELLRTTGLLEIFWPELLEGVSVEQNRHHAFTIWEHSLGSLQAMAEALEEDPSLRLASLLHDVAKARCLSVDEEGERHFYNHQVVGAAVARRMLKRLRYDNRTIERVVHLIENHMALHHYPDMKDAAIRRLINRVGLENIHDLIQLRIADRAGSGTKDTPLSRGTLHLLRRIERVLEEDAAFGLEDLAVDGNDVMRVAEIEPGPEVGEILNQLLEEVLDEPSLNQKDVLEQRITELAQRGDRG